MHFYSRRRKSNPLLQEKLIYESTLFQGTVAQYEHTIVLLEKDCGSKSNLGLIKFTISYMNKQKIVAAWVVALMLTPSFIMEIENFQIPLPTFEGRCSTSFEPMC